MVNDQKSVSESKDRKSRNQISDKGDENSKPNPPNQDKWHKEMLSRLFKKSKAIELAKQQITKLTDKNNVLECIVKTKNEEIEKLNGKILLLTRELASIKKDHLQALKDIKVLKAKVLECACKNEINKERKTLYSKMQTELDKSEQMLTQERLKNDSLEKLKINLHKWRALQYSDPHYFEILLRKNFLQKELQKKIHMLQSKEVQLAQKDILLNKLRAMLKRRPSDLIEEPHEQMMNYYRLIQVQKDKIKSLAAQVNMYETLLQNEHSKLKTSGKNK